MAAEALEELEALKGVAASVGWKEGDRAYKVAKEAILLKHGLMGAKKEKKEAAARSSIKWGWPLGSVGGEKYLPKVLEPAKFDYATELPKVFDGTWVVDRRAPGNNVQRRWRLATIGPPHVARVTKDKKKPGCNLQVATFYGDDPQPQAEPAEVVPHAPTLLACLLTACLPCAQEDGEEEGDGEEEEQEWIEDPKEPAADAPKAKARGKAAKAKASPGKASPSKEIKKSARARKPSRR